jgi:hemerythrin-like metal-binding protein
MTILKSTGDPDIDKVHQKMVDMMLSIIRHTENGSTVPELKIELLNLYSIAEVHFKEEEELMQDIKYPFIKTHFIAHEDILHKIRVFLEVLEHTKKDYNLLLKSLLKTIENHVDHYDIALFSFNALYLETQ